jgi:hypothetical protein
MRTHGKVASTMPLQYKTSVVPCGSRLNILVATILSAFSACAGPGGEDTPGSASASLSNSVAGSVGIDTQALNHEPAAAVDLHDTCVMDAIGGQGNCSRGLVCAVFNTAFPVCWDMSPCISTEIPTGLGICATACDASNGGPAACPSGMVCDENIWCVPANAQH